MRTLLFELWKQVVAWIIKAVCGGDMGGQLRQPIRIKIIVKLYTT